MKGFQISFYTLRNRRHRGQQMHEWLMQTAKAQGIRGSTVVEAAQGQDHSGGLHATHLFSLADQPMEITMAMEVQQVEQFMRLLEQEGVDLFYVKTAVEFGTVGSSET